MRELSSQLCIGPTEYCWNFFRKQCIHCTDVTELQTELQISEITTLRYCNPESILLQTLIEQRSVKGHEVIGKSST